MEIQNSSLSMQAQHQKSSSYQRKESLSISSPGSPVIPNTSPQITDSSVSPADNVTLSADSQRASQTNEACEASTKSNAPMKDLNLWVLKIMVERITGKKIKMMDMEGLYQSSEASAQAQQEQLNLETTGGWGLEYHQEETITEHQSLSFQAEGQVMTKDGREIDVSISLNMSREFIQHKELNIQAGEALKDPLVVNFAGNAAELSQTKFAFDLDCNGQDNQISCLSPGSGFLALDRNQDNQINDGSELFGPSTGKGFSELSAFDEDENNWIDANDSLYDRLRIWTREANGESRLFGLGEKGIGAICLDHEHTPFDLKDQSNALQGQIKSTGLFLQESGQAGTIQELDFVI